jgi:hypothetical protein
VSASLPYDQQFVGRGGCERRKDAWILFASRFHASSDSAKSALLSREDHRETISPLKKMAEGVIAAILVSTAASRVVSATELLFEYALQLAFGNILQNQPNYFDFELFEFLET